MLTWLLYVQFTPSTFSLIITYLNQWNFDFYIFQLHLKLLLMLIKSEESLFECNFKFSDWFYCDTPVQEVLRFTNSSTTIIRNNFTKANNPECFYCEIRGYSSFFKASLTVTKTHKVENTDDQQRNTFKVFLSGWTLRSIREVSPAVENLSAVVWNNYIIEGFMSKVLGMFSCSLWDDSNIS